MDAATETMKHTPLYDAHVGAGARMVPFAGYQMPVQYTGVMGEHNHCRDHAGLFDVSHMGQAWVRGDKATEAFEALVPGDLRALKPGRQKYSLLMTKDGGIIDDLMISRPTDDGLFIVVNGACKAGDFDHIAAHLPAGVTLEVLTDRALMALQGPEAVDVLKSHIPAVADMVFMDARVLEGFDTDVIVSRSGYTGMDGFEISVPAAEAPRIWATLLQDERVQPIGLGARDSLRLEAGLPLYGHDIDTTTSPVEAGLKFAVSKSRRERADFPGAERVLREWAEGPSRVRVGLKITAGAPAREGVEVVDTAGTAVGHVTSGGFGPTVGGAIAMAYVKPSCAEPGTRLKALVRGRESEAEVVAMPFVPASFVR